VKITTVLFVDSIEKSLTFWRDRAGFTAVAEMPDGDRLGFVILVRDGAELMLQTYELGKKDDAELMPKGGGHAAALFIEVDDLADMKKRLEGYPITMAERVTSYGMREIGVRDPDGNPVVFARKE
jgi:catechol 2,3-dioxygenase-like lactoylglutathione lyase family enzyme